VQVRAKAAIEECLAEYVRLAAERPGRWTTVDRAYVRVYEGEPGILFTHGEVGTFGPRSPDYYSILGCHVAELDGLRVIYLAETRRAPIIGTERDLSAIYSRTGPAETDGRAVELVLLRTNDGFEFSQAQTYSDDNLYRHNPSLRIE
jgi:hypothetical protein